MQFLKNLFRKREEPESSTRIEGVGSLDWDAESEYWVGTYNGFKVSVAYDGFCEPKDELSQFVTQSLGKPNYLETKISEIKALAKTQYPAGRHSEIESLQARDVVFQNPNFILIQFFGPGDNEPFWFAEIHGSDIYVGCDT